MTRDYDRTRRWLLGLAERTVAANYDRATLVSDMFFESAEAISFLLSENTRLREAMERLERANDGLCATRSEDTYIRMIDQDNAEDALHELDIARRNARAVLSSPPQPSERP